MEAMKTPRKLRPTLIAYWDAGVTMRCTEVADRPPPDGEFSCRDIGDRGRSCLASDFVVLVLDGCLNCGNSDR